MFQDCGQGFLEKNSNGVMAKYCQRCHKHLDLHGFGRVVGAKGGSIRCCPPDALAAAQQQQHQAAVDVVYETPERSPHRFMGSTPAPSTQVPYGSELTTPQGDQYVRLRKNAEMTPSNHLGGSSCAVVQDDQADNFIPIHIAGRGQHRTPQGHLEGAAAFSNFNELDGLKKPSGREHQSHRSSMVGGGLLPQ